MTIAAARLLSNDDVCFVGIGAPSAACNLARLTHAPKITLIYESGTLSTRPTVCALHRDGELCDTALTTVSCRRCSATGCRAGASPIGFLGGAQIDRFGNLNTTVVGPYDAPKCACPARRRAGDRHQLRPDLHHHGHGPARLHGQAALHHLARPPRQRQGLARGAGGEDPRPDPSHTDLCIFEPDPETSELTVTSIHPGVTREQIQENCGWPVKFAAAVRETPAPDETELSVLRDLHARTKAAHAA